MKKTVLFICTHNSARSQIAEGLLNALYGDKYEAYSAGMKPTEVNLYAAKAMAEIGVDISKHRSKSIEEFRGKTSIMLLQCVTMQERPAPSFQGTTFFNTALLTRQNSKAVKKEY